MNDSGPVQRIDTVVPIGEVGDGAVRVRYMPDPPKRRCEFEVFYDWGDGDEQTVYVGNVEHAERLVQSLEDLIHAAKGDEK